MGASRKLYIPLARTLSEFQNDMPATTFVRLVMALADDLKQDNMQFDTDKFRQAACKQYERF